MNVPDRNQIAIGSRVWIETKQNQGTGELTEGIVKEILTHAKSHPHGIKVRLDEDRIGRVKRINSARESVPTAKGFVDLHKIEIPDRENMENEFKETFQYDRRMANHAQNERAINGMKYNGPVVLAKAICSLGNSYAGGFVFLGIADNGDTVGLEEDRKLGNFADYEDKFAKAVDMAHDSMDQENRMYRRWTDRLLNRLADAGGVLNGHPVQRLPHNLNVRFEGIDGKAIINSVSDRLAVSAGSACTARTVEPSHVLLAMGMSEEQAHSSLRIGCGRFNTEQDIDVAAECIGNAVRSLERIR